MYDLHKLHICISHCSPLMMMQFKIMENIFNKKHKRNKTRNTVNFIDFKKNLQKYSNLHTYKKHAFPPCGIDKP